MKEVVLLPENERARWDDFVEHHPLGWLTSLSSWSSVLSSLPNNIKTYRLALVDDSHEIIAGLPIYLLKSPLLDKKLIGAPLATFFDPLVKTEEELHLLLSAALQLKKKTGSSSIKLKTFKSQEMFASAEFTRGRIFFSHLLPLANEPSALLASFDRTCIRKNIKRAEHYGPEFLKISDKDGIYSFYRLYSLTRKRLGLPALPFSFFKAIYDLYGPTGNAHFFLLNYQQRPVASLLLLSYRGRWSAEALGWDTNYKLLSPSVVIYWEAIKFAQAAGGKIFDFGRTSVENKGLLTFKRHWGTQEVQIPIYVFPPTIAGESSVLTKTGLEILAHFIFCNVPLPTYLGLSKMFYRIFME